MPSNYTSHHTTNWYPEPTTRGTWSLIYSAVFTLSLCVYSAIHVNVPHRGDTANVQFWRKAKWVVIAIFAPEVLLLSAWQQYYIAGQFCSILHNIAREQAGLPTISTKTWLRKKFDRYFPATNNTKGEKTTREEAPGNEETSQIPGPPKFSRMFGFYVLMGGLVVDVSPLYDNDKISRMTLTPAGVLKFARESSWEKFIVPDETIIDKSKADNLGKLLVFFQVSWAIFQCISRQVLGYPLTVLEVHVLVHAICALFMYAFWFHKPLNVLDPSYVNFSDERLERSLALEMMRTPGSAYYPFTGLTPQREFKCIPHRDKKQEQYWDSACEAAFLVFDTERLQQVLELSSRERSIEEQPAVVSIIDPDTNELSNEIQNPLYSADEDLQASAESWREESGRVSTVALESQEPSSTLQHVARIHRDVFPDYEKVVSIGTGQILTTGVGPAAFATSLSPTGPDQVRTFLAKYLPLKSPAKPGLPAVEDEFPLKEQMIPAIYQDSGHVLKHALTVDLTQKDLRRWHRAALAFAQEYSAVEQIEQDNTESRDPSLRHQDRTRLCFLFATTREEQDIGDYHENLDLYYTEYLVKRCENIHLCSFSAIKAKMEVSLRAMWTFVLVSGAYASVHLTLWNHKFPTQLEQLLWRISGCILLFPCGLGVYFAVVGLPTAALVYWFQTRKTRKNRLARFRKSQPAKAPEGEPLVTEPRVFEQVVSEVNSVADNDNLVRNSQQTQGLNINSLNIPLEAVSGPENASNTEETLSEVEDNTCKSEHSQGSLLRERLETLGLLLFLIPLISIGIVLDIAIVCVLIAQVPARLYIVVESFISLRQVPLAVYNTVSWAQYIPHL